LIEIHRFMFILGLLSSTLLYPSPSWQREFSGACLET